MAELNLENWTPMSPLKGPPLPRFFGVYWPWYKEGEGAPGGAGSDIRVEELSISPAHANVGETVVITATAKNYGTGSGTKTITCTVNGNSTDQTVSLEPDVSQLVTFEVIPSEEGTFSVTLDGLSGSFSVLSRKVSVSLGKELVCNRWYGGQCTGYASDERNAVLKVTNQGVPRQLTSSLSGWELLNGQKLSQHFPPQTWSDNFESGQTRSYSVHYVIPTTGMPIQSYFLVDIKDDMGVVFTQDYITGL